MDDSALQQELEALADNAYNPDVLGDDVNTQSLATTIQRWQKLFDISDDNAAELIMNHRNNLTRMRISDGHWETIKAIKEAKGYDREAYEYELNIGKKKAVADVLPLLDDASNVTYLVELNAPLDTPEKVQKVAGMTEVPETVTGRSVEYGRLVSLCCINGQAKTEILRWVAKQGSDLEPTILADPRSLK